MEQTSCGERMPGYGFVHACAVTGGGDAYCWVKKGWGQLGMGNTTDRSERVLVATSP